MPAPATTPRPDSNRLPTLADMSLRQQERGLVLGGVGTGKSTLADLLGQDFIHRYAAKHARRLILDSKPRYRAEHTVNGAPAKRRYKGWSHGAFIPGSVLVDDPDDLELAWKTGARTVIVSGESQRDIPRLAYAAELFLKQARASRPQLLQVDETCDFFHTNGSPIGGNDSLIRVARAGRERGCGGLYGSQRTKGIPPTLMEEMTRLYCFRVDYKADIKRVQEMGAPPFPMPTKKHQFMYWWKEDYDRVWGPYRLNLEAA